MPALLTLAGVICFLLGTTIVVILAVRAGAGSTGGGIARILYDAEHPEKTR